LVRLHFRYAVEYLIEEGLLSSRGTVRPLCWASALWPADPLVRWLTLQHDTTPHTQPINLSGLVTHLFWTEPSNFLFLTMLNNGVFKRICDPIANCQGGKEGLCALGVTGFAPAAL
jgi:hypothetical protein